VPGWHYCRDYNELVEFCGVHQGAGELRQAAVNGVAALPLGACVEMDLVVKA
jgi:hypothetical protein